MKKWKLMLTAVVPMALALSFPAMAGQWHQDMNGWWYEHDDGSYCRNGWEWIDGDQDGWAECYYFGNKGYMIDANSQVDGYEIDENGAWCVDGQVQKKAVPVPGAENDPAAVAAYQAAVAKNGELKSFDVDVDYDMTMSAEGESIGMTMNMNMKTKEDKEGKMEFLMDGTMNLLGSEMPVTMFYTDGTMYMDMLGMKQKQPMGELEALEQANSQMEGMDVDLSAMKGMKLRTEGDKTIIAFDMDTTALNDILGTTVDTEMYKALGMDVSYQITASDGEVVINKDGYYESMNIYMAMEMNIVAEEESTKMAYEIGMDMIYKNPGQPVNFELPSTEGYEETVELE